MEPAAPSSSTSSAPSTTSGTPTFRGTFRDSVWQRMLRDAALPATMRFHDLRHFTASALVQNGQSVKTVQAVLGHSSATETLGHRGHLWPDAEENVRAAMDRTFMSPGPAL